VKGTPEFLPPEVFDFDAISMAGEVDYSTAGDMW
jgi:hypothetical protein